ncbi:DnaA regulatory inactivator Hda [methanotrophic endosymbiont of Bathymodiolus puteoserpentis (Logatchev)]|jgi:DnaA family protein|uniref:DnaA regulatory inactivator Hda n=1 Tax=methanotrophic endosymbiont of Bathymodiolus puteoserpentis (Logatchev) TaxID=343235 RepID=UPI0013CB6430|nr:Chromosomal replication initiator protein DnaA [methanotrophic endosymbiont of Bathymodiolus puteoserpentis (Logatchev)]
MISKQQPLQFDFKAEQSFSSFYAGCNHEIVQHLTNSASGKGEQQLYIWGEEGLGKTHLLQACCQQSYQLKRSSLYLSLDKKKLPSTDILQGLESFDLVCIDNLEECAGNNEWELALFNFYNLHRDNGHKLILAAHVPPNFLPIQLPDLKTRMAWGLTLKLQELSDAERIAAFTCKAKYLGFEISPKIGDFLTKHYARDLPALWDLLEQLDQETLIAKRKLTLPFLKQILAKQE